MDEQNRTVYRSARLVDQKDNTSLDCAGEEEEKEPKQVAGELIVRWYKSVLARRNGTSSENTNSMADAVDKQITGAAEELGGISITDTVAWSVYDAFGEKQFFFASKEAADDCVELISSLRKLDDPSYDFAHTPVEGEPPDLEIIVCEYVEKKVL